MTLNVLMCPAHYQLDPALGSEFSWVGELIRHLPAVGCRVTAITGRSGLENYSDTSIVELGFSKADLSLGSRLRFVRRYSREAHRLMREAQYDIFHHVLPFGMGSTFNPIILKAPSNVPVVIGPVQERLGALLDEGVYETADRGEMKARSQRSRRTALIDRVLVNALPIAAYLSRRTLRRADVIVAASQAAAERCRDITRGEVALVPPGIDCERFAPTDNAEGREILFVGYLVRRKRVDLLLRAVAELGIRTGISPPVRIVGDGPERRKLEALAAELGIGDRVRFEGAVGHDRLTPYYHQATVVCLLSATEVAPTVPLEAMACGVPIVATPVGNLPDLLKKHKVGLSVQPDTAQVAEALFRLMTQDSWRRQLGREGRRVAEAHFSSKIIAVRYREVYEEAAARRLREATRGLTGAEAIGAPSAGDHMPVDPTG